MVGAGAASQSGVIPRAHEHDAERIVDVELSSQDSEEVPAGELPDELDVQWAQTPEPWHLSRWLAQRARGACRSRLQIKAAKNVVHDKEATRACKQLNISMRTGDRKKQKRLSKAELMRAVTEKAQAVLQALRRAAASPDAQTEQIMNALAAKDTPRAKVLFDAGNRLHDPTVSQKSFRKVLVELDLPKAAKRNWRDREEEAKEGWRKECKKELGARCAANGIASLLNTLLRLL